jgi:hypothetical protein
MHPQKFDQVEDMIAATICYSTLTYPQVPYVQELTGKCILFHLCQKGQSETIRINLD